MKYNLAKKFLSFSYGSWAGLVIGVMSTAITTRVLEPNDFGKASMFTLALNILVIIALLGSDQSFVRFFYEEESAKRGGLLYTCISPSIIIAIIISIIILLFQKSIAIFLWNEINSNMIYLLIIGFFFNILFRYSILVIRMQQKGHLYSLVEILNRMINLMMFILFYFYIGPSYKILIYSVVATFAILSIINIVLEKDIWNVKNIFLKDLKHNKIEVIKYGSPLIITLLITFLFQSFDKIAIKQWSTFQELGLYAGAFKIVALVNVLQMNFSSFWIPVCYEHYEKSPDDRMFYSKVSQIVTFVMFSVAILSIAGKDVIVYLLGKNYHEASNIMPFLVFMPVMYTISETTVVGINFFKKPKLHIIIASISCIANIVGNWWLVPLYGATGASISTAFSYILFFFLRTKFSLKFYKVNYKLKKIATMIIALSIYALFSIIYRGVVLNIFAGITVFIILIYMYIDQIKTSLKYLKECL